MTSTYKQIKSRFLSKIESYEYLKKSEDDLNDEFIKEWLHSAVAKPQTRKLFSKIILDDETATVEYSLSEAVDDFSDAEFVIDILAYGIGIGWLEPKVYSIVNIQQMYGGKEQKFYAQANHLNAIQSLLSRFKIEQKKLIRDHGANYNSYIGVS